MTFEAARSQIEPTGFGSRTVYGFDFMIDDKLDPYLLEVNFMPDLHFAHNSDRTFVRKMFDLMFKGIEDDSFAVRV